MYCNCDVIKFHSCRKHRAIKYSRTRSRFAYKYFVTVMADTLKREYSCFLFTNGDGSPIVFHLQPSKEKLRLRSLIEASGGLVTSDNVSNAIRLILPTRTAKADNLVSSTYISDCIEKNKLLDIKSYRVLKGQTFMSNADPNPYVLKMQSKSKCGRVAYTVSEDLKIIHFLLKNDCLSSVNGITLWQKLECLKLMKHSWQSMKHRFRKCILPNIKSYNLTQEEIAKFKEVERETKGHSRPKQPTSKHPVIQYSSTEDEDEDDFEEDKAKEAKTGEDEEEEEEEQDDDDDVEKKARTGKDDDDEDKGKRARTEEDDDDDEEEEEDKGKRARTEEDDDDDEEEEDEGKKARAGDDCDVDEFDENLVNMAKRSQRSFVGSDESDEADRYGVSKHISRVTQLSDADSCRRKKTRSCEEVLSDWHVPDVVRSGIQSSRAVKYKNEHEKIAESVEHSVAEDTEMDSEGTISPRQSVVHQNQHLMDRSRKRRNSFGEVQGICHSEVAVADSQGERTSVNLEMETAVKQHVMVAKQDKQNITEADGAVNAVGAYSGKGLRYHTFGEIEGQMNCRRRNTVPANSKDIGSAGASKQAEKEEIRKLKKAVEVSSTTNPDFVAESSDVKDFEKSLATCHNLMAWLDISPQIFAQAVFLNNGSVDKAVSWLLCGSGNLWDPHDDLMFIGSKAQYKLLEEYGKQETEEHHDFLFESVSFNET